ncbi:MAG: adenylosuccinate lyase [Anaerolineaceae bacterium 4572_78]|nr:MAG: adenylosuccinate lyase [Anaerolineaceae bacterium 4572_78]
MITLSSLTAISPLDGRYRIVLSDLAFCFSEYALIKFRACVEVEWFIALAESVAIPELRNLYVDEIKLLRQLVFNLDEKEALLIKQIEKTTNHDLKAVEYYLKQKLSRTSLERYQEFVHFACTSEDINNLAHALMLKKGIGCIWQGKAEMVIQAIDELAKKYQTVPMLAHTHGQAASPTTVGKEMAVFRHRLKRQLQFIKNQSYLGKINGAVGNFNAHQVAYPDMNWSQFAHDFVEKQLGLTYNPLTTQIESHDYIAEIFHNIIRFNTIILDFNCDMWLYISKGYFRQKMIAGEVGSSTMPHKVNPIDFENSEGNIGISNAMLTFMAQKLPVSRLQRDLSDSTVLRNMGVAIGHSFLALHSTIKGIAKLAIDEVRLQQDLNNTWQVLAEPIQTVMRKYGLENPYNQLKDLTRGKLITQAELAMFIKNLPISDEDKACLLDLTPANYLGLATII